MTTLGTSGGVTVSKLDKQTYTSEFESHWAPHSFGLVPHQSKALWKLHKDDYLKKIKEFPKSFVICDCKSFKRQKEMAIIISEINTLLVI